VQLQTKGTYDPSIGSFGLIAIIVGVAVSVLPKKKA